MSRRPQPTRSAPTSSGSSSSRPRGSRSTTRTSTTTSSLGGCSAAPRASRPGAAAARSWRTGTRRRSSLRPRRRERRRCSKTTTAPPYSSPVSAVRAALAAATRRTRAGTSYRRAGSVRCVRSTRPARSPICEGTRRTRLPATRPPVCHRHEHQPLTSVPMMLQRCAAGSGCWSWSGGRAGARRWVHRSRLRPRRTACRCC